MDFMKWVFLFLMVLVGMHESKACLEVERSALLKFKAFVYSECYNGDYLLPSWKDDPTSECCDWEGVACDRTTGHVMELSLDNIRKLSYFNYSNPSKLTNGYGCFFNISMFQDLNELLLLNLAYNGISGWAHSKGFENSPKLSKLKRLDLSYNFIPENMLSFIGKLLSLEFLSLSGNPFYRPFPVHEIYGLSNLKVLLLARNYIKGSLSIQNRTVLHKLQVLDLSYNQLGSFSVDIGALTSLKALSVARNGLNETTFSGLCGFMILEELDLRNNDFTVVPQCLQNLTSLELLDLSQNSINGQLPMSWISQRNLRYVDLSHNNLEGRVPSWLLANNSKMQVLLLANNSFTGDLNTLLHPMKDLRSIDVSDNQMQGMLPENVGTILPSLKSFVLSSNAFRGHLPVSIGLLRNLKILDLSHNKFNGQIPDTIFNCTQLMVLKLSNNEFCGKFFSPQYN